MEHTDVCVSLLRDLLICFHKTVKCIISTIYNIYIYYARASLLDRVCVKYYKSRQHLQYKHYNIINEATQYNIYTVHDSLVNYNYISFVLNCGTIISN